MLEKKFVCESLALILLTIAGSGVSFSQDAIDPVPTLHEPLKLPGLQQNGETLIFSQWSLRPAGIQVPLGDFPVNIALHPTAPYAAVLHAGYGEHEIIIVDLKTRKTVCRVPLRETFYGICFSPEGDRLFASGSQYETVHQFKFGDGLLSEPRTIKAAKPSQKGAIAGLACSHDGKTLYAADAWGDRVAMIPLGEPDNTEFVVFDKGTYPYAVIPNADGSLLYASLWGGSAVAVIDAKSGKATSVWKTSSHPTEMVLSPKEDLLYVACANSNSVVALDTSNGKSLETFTTALFPHAPNGSTPNSLALSADGKVLLVANADNNNVAAIDVSEKGRGKPLGFIPAGEYPTSVRFNGNDKRFFIANGKGVTPKANRHGPNPLIKSPKTTREYIAGLYQGTLSIVKSPTPEEMTRFTKDAYACSPLRENLEPAGRGPEANNPIPAKVGNPSPIKHCIYIIKENRTYDQIFGDIPEGNGDKSLCIFPERITPNLHALAKEFVLLDNFYVNSEVSADGHEWSMAAYATDYVEKVWPLTYRRGENDTIKSPGEGRYPIANPSSGYFWDRCKEAGVSYYSYGEFVHNELGSDGKTGATNVETLKGHFDPGFCGWNLGYSDQKRADRFIEELHRYEKEGEFPRFCVMRLPNDHTSGAKAGMHTPTAMVADNDLALGRIVEAVSKSKFWAETAIFVVEDDAQNGSDHVDAHRTEALVISPYTKRHCVDSSFYSTTSMLRTMELILGLQPMTQFDAAAHPMYDSFQPNANAAPFEHRPANVDLLEMNDSLAYGSKISEKLDFSKEDSADDLVLNEIVWKSVRGASSPMPSPVRACFVFPHQPAEDE